MDRQRWAWASSSQYTILCRGLDLLRVGGRLVYSTCSFNPIEDEAVVAAVVRKYGSSVELLPLPHLDGLHGQPGLETWLVPHPDDPQVLWRNFDQVPQELSSKVRSSMFPAPPDSTDAENWRRACKHCRRFLPHEVSGGGFFVAVFAKVASPISRRASIACPEKVEHSVELLGAEDSSLCSKKNISVVEVEPEHSEERASKALSNDSVHSKDNGKDRQGQKPKQRMQPVGDFEPLHKMTRDGNRLQNILGWILLWQLSSSGAVTLIESYIVYLRVLQVSFVHMVQ